MTTDIETSGRSSGQMQPETDCYSLTIFTQQWGEIRRFYKDVLGAQILSERTNRYCDMILGGLPICLRPCEFGESVSYFHIYLSVRDPETILKPLREQGIIITTEGPYTNFRDPEGRVFKVSDHAAIVA